MTSAESDFDPSKLGGFSKARFVLSMVFRSIAFPVPEMEDAAAWEKRVVGKMSTDGTLGEISRAKYAGLRAFLEKDGMAPSLASAFVRHVMWGDFCFRLVDPETRKRGLDFVKSKVGQSDLSV